MITHALRELRQSPSYFRHGFSQKFNKENPYEAMVARLSFYAVLDEVKRAWILLSLCFFCFRAIGRENLQYAAVCVGWVYQYIYYCWLEDHYPTVNLQQMNRMETYAALKPGEDKDRVPPNMERTSKLAHEVLLGTLKKVEAKSASLLVIWTLFVSSLFVVITTLPAVEKQLRAVLVAFVLFCLPTIILLTKCFKQLDLMDLPVGKKTSATGMQSYLFFDLAEKERLYRFAQKMTFVTAWLSGFLLLMWIEALTRQG
ncbi:hypothetical protein [Paracoccus sanguinis]|uniref:hypothetical protein n=1 Tax=Paracoccus sanguinis TaxID=1545044 RepID=UPI0012DFEA0E|nr:hypothetical protein [Paracoccus sanguinis]